MSRAPAPVIEYVSSALVIEYVAPAPAVTLAVPSEQLLLVYTTSTIATDVNLDITGLVSPQFSSTAVEVFAPQVVVSLPPFEEFIARVYNQVHQEQNVAGEMTLNTVQEQVTVQEIPQVSIVVRIQEQIADITGLVNPQFSFSAVEASAPQVVGSLPPFEEFDAPVCSKIHQEQIFAEETTQNTYENLALQEQVISGNSSGSTGCRFISSLGRCCGTRVQPSPSGINRCDSTAACSFSRNSRDSGCGADTGATC